MIKHIVFFRLKDNSKEEVQKVIDMIEDMEDKIDILNSIEVGANVVPSDRSYDLALIAEFNSLEDLQKYDVHPVHEEVKVYIKERANDVAAVDYKF